MKIAINTNRISPHTAPLALILREMGHRVAYIYHDREVEKFRTVTTGLSVSGFARFASVGDKRMDEALVKSDIVMENVRNFAQIRELLLCGKRVLYVSERWFKPVRVDSPNDSECAKGRGLWADGFIKMLFPFAFKRAIQIVRLLHREKSFLYLPIGIFAARDMARLCGLMNGDLRCLFRAPQLGFEQRPGGRIWALDGKDERYCLGQMRMWGYFVESAKREEVEYRDDSGPLIRILWVGRMLGWKRVDTIIRAIRGMANASLDLIGAGPEEMRLKRMAKELHNVHFKGMVPLAEVRQQMREHDVYVLSSNEFEGWGAVINEALEEGMQVFGTYEAGASATILPESNLFHCGDWRALRLLLQIRGRRVGIGSWAVKCAAQEVIKIAKEVGEC